MKANQRTNYWNARSPELRRQPKRAPIRIGGTPPKRRFPRVVVNAMRTYDINARIMHRR